MHQQTTIKKITAFEGIGVHSGKLARLELHPAPPNFGVQFYVMNHSQCMTVIPAQIDYAVKKQLRTVLANHIASVDTVEHLLAAVYGVGVDNLIVKVWGGEIPISNGSANKYCQLLYDAELIKQEKNKRYFKVLDTIKVQSADAWCMLEPWDSYLCCYTLDYQHPNILQQHVCFDINPQSFAKNLSSARTFGFIEDFETMKKLGLGHGATLDNTVVFTKDGLLPGVDLVWPDEPARHKIVDAIGDLALIGFPILGKFTGYRSGHNLNQQLAAAAKSSAGLGEIVELDPC